MIYSIDPLLGLIYGRGGLPIRKKAKGYVLVGTNPRRTAHRMIWEYVNGPVPTGMQINHINGIKHDNRISNLELVTPSGNTAHAYRAGLTHRRGESNGRALLSELQVLEIRRRRASGELSTKLCKEYGVSARTICDIANRNKWSHLP